ncbi:MAG: metallophosphoesterase [Oscillospiraceae bacterium]|nr:metallophosphoesterase [Oscillospiraceae bacterium]
MKKKYRALKIAAICFAILTAGFVAELIWENNTIGVTRYTIAHQDIPAAFDGYKIIVLADIQGTDFGEKLLNIAADEQADLAVFPGDLAHSRIDDSVKIISRLLESGALPELRYAVSGNHDAATADFERLWRQEWHGLGLYMLENESVEIERDGEVIFLHGIADAGFSEPYLTARYARENRDLINTQEGYNVLLFHRANMLDMFTEDEFDLIISGHVHGGQVRIPFLGGLISPQKEIFPKYDSGVFTVNDNHFVVSRGIGNYYLIPRVFNRPEVVVITLESIK